jgi:hypothetical protein
MRDYVTNSNVTNPLVTQRLDTFQDQLKKSNQLDRVLLALLEQSMCILLNDDIVDHTDFMQTFGNINHINDDKYIRMADAFPKFNIWEKETLYLIQTRQTADWYSLNQIIVFFERYDFRHYDNLIGELDKATVNTSKLQEEHSTLIMHTHFDDTKTSNLFPTMEEYKLHMTILLESIKEIIVSPNISNEVYEQYNP